MTSKVWNVDLKSWVMVEKENPQGRPKWVPEGAIKMVYQNTNPKAASDKKRPEVVWIQPEMGEKPMYNHILDVETGTVTLQTEPHQYATNKGWLMSKYLREPEPEENEFGKVCP